MFVHFFLRAPHMHGRNARRFVMTTNMYSPSPFGQCQAFLLAEFILLHLAKPPANELINFLGTVEAILWLQVRLTPSARCLCVCLFPDSHCIEIPLHATFISSALFFSPTATVCCDLACVKFSVLGTHSQLPLFMGQQPLETFVVLIHTYCCCCFAGLHLASVLVVVRDSIRVRRNVWDFSQAFGVGFFQHPTRFWLD